VSRVVSTTVMITQLEGLLGTKDLTEDQTAFVEKLSRIKNAGEVTRLTDAQIDYLMSLHRRHFA
jgi:hypothetical protein